MPIQIVRNDITKMPVDAIVNAANESLLGGGGVDGAIHRAAGPKLLAECRTLHGCPTGQAKITGAYNLPCKYVIHTVGPIWRGGQNGERDLLTSAYRNSMTLAMEHHCESVAFPLISAGVYGYPKAQAIQVAMNTVSAFLLEHELDMTVYIVVFNKESFQLSTKLFGGVQQYIDDHYAEARAESCRARSDRRMQAVEAMEAMPVMEAMPCAAPKSAMSLEEALDQLDESFSQMVLRKIQEKGMKNSTCYKKANLDRKHFSKLANDAHYTPKKTTALALAVALELSLEETKELLNKAGLALSHSSKFDIIVEYFILQGNYDIFAINEVLFYYDQMLLGSVG